MPFYLINKSDVLNHNIYSSRRRKNISDNRRPFRISLRLLFP